MVRSDLKYRNSASTLNDLDEKLFRHVQVNVSPTENECSQLQMQLFVLLITERCVWHMSTLGIRIAYVCGLYLLYLGIIRFILLRDSIKDMSVCLFAYMYGG